MLDFYVSEKHPTDIYPTTTLSFLKNNNFLSRYKAANLFKSINFFLREKLLRKSLICLVLLGALISSQYVLAQVPPTGFTSSVVSSQWSGAVGLTFSQTGKMFVWEKSGKVWVVENNQKQLLLDISPEVGDWRDFGLLGFALHPQFETNGYFYLLYTVDRHHLINFGTTNYNAATNEYYRATIGRVTRYTATKTTTGTGYTVNATSRKILLGATKTTGIPVLHESHGVGSLVFGTDGTLLVSAGDGASYTLDDTGSATGTYFTQALADGIITDQENVGSFRAQLLESYNGKILRIDAETGNGISSNPFYNSALPASVRSKIWALGFRNPFRMSLRPNSGSTISTDGKPGVLYVGDVGYTTWEEISIVTKPGMNFGWPLFEGLTQHNGYMSKLTQNKHAPNPLYNQNGCTQQYFNFQDLLKQATASGTATFANPCNTTQTVPTTVKTFLHSRPGIDWNHNSVSARTGTFSGETATVTAIGATGSPVAGTQFTGNSVTAGVFYPHADFPTEYRNNFYFSDYNDSWLRRMKTDATDKPTAVNSFITSGAVVVCMATHPTEPGLYYVNYPSEIRKVTYNATNSPPVAVASVDKTFGQSGTSFQFTGSSSRDPEGLPLTYLWNFGDGTTSTAVNPLHTFITATNTPTKFTVTLTVKDNLNSTNQTSLSININNSPPQVTITSPVNNTIYPMTSETIYALRANVTDVEQISSELSYRWITTLHHNEHEHPETAITTAEASATISPLGCGAETYYYSISLTVTDGGGLSTTKVVNLYPDCNKKPTVALTAPVSGSSYPSPANITLTANASDTDGTISRVEFYRGTIKLGQDDFAPYSFTWTNVPSGTYSLTAKAVDNEGAITTSSAVTVNVTSASAPSVTLTSPTASTLLNAPATIALAATASDADGSVAKVEFFNGTVKLGEDLTSPYTYSWANVTYGTYTLTAKATDATGVTKTSAAVVVTVRTKVVGFTLIDAKTGQILIQNLVSGTTINLGSLGTKKFNIRANTSTPGVGSVASNLTGADTKHSIDNTAPYYLVPGGGFWMPNTGNYTLKATPYSGTNTTGTPGTSLTITFSVVKSGSTTALKTEMDADNADMGPTEMSISYFPNPYTHEFTLLVQGKQNKVLPVRMYDTAGRLVLTLDDVPDSEPLYLGKKLRSGMYTLEVGTGKDAKKFKLLKTY